MNSYIRYFLATTIICSLSTLNTIKDDDRNENDHKGDDKNYNDTAMIMIPA